MLEAVVLAFGLAMDATAVAAARGFARRPGELVALPLLFGAFQAGMAALGWVLGAWSGRYVAAFDHWIAFGLLVLIGGKMLVEAWRGDGDPDARPPGLQLWLLLALATSIDAAAAGITLPLVPVAPWLALVLIGTITWACALAAYVASRAVTRRSARPGADPSTAARLAERTPKLEIAGGLILIGLGVKILVQHLS